MTDEYVGPDPEIADIVHRTDLESDQQTQRLKKSSVDELKAVVRNNAESTVARGTALLGLMGARDPELNDIILELFDDGDQELWRMVIEARRLTDPRIRARLYDLLDDADENNWSIAAVVLARAKEVELLPRFIAWLEEGDEPHRNVGVECLKSLGTPTAQVALQEFWNRGKGDADIRLVIAAALIESGDQRGRALLDSVARDAKGAWSVFAATSVYFAQPRDGLALMLQVLDHGDLEAKQAMVNQIWNFAHLPHAFTADGLSEARVWAQSQLESLPA